MLTCVCDASRQTRQSVAPRKAAKRHAAARMSLAPVAQSLATLPTGLNLAAGLEVTFPAYLAIFLGTLIPCAFLVILYIQGESRKAGEREGRGEQ